VIAQFFFSSSRSRRISSCARGKNCRLRPEEGTSRQIKMYLLRPLHARGNFAHATVRGNFVDDLPRC
jgi:hypothetical protein